MDHLDGITDSIDQIQERYQSGLTDYKKRDWSGAMHHFRAAAELSESERLSRLYIDRCEHFMAHPPAADWDGVWTMTSK